MPVEHYCHCGAWGAFGYGVSLLKGREGQWYCWEHRPDATAATAPKPELEAHDPGPEPAYEPDLFSRK